MKWPAAISRWSAWLKARQAKRLEIIKSQTTLSASAERANNIWATIVAMILIFIGSLALKSSPGDLLAFLGAIIGSALTVFAAFMIHGRQRNIDRDAEYEPIRGAVNALVFGLGNYTDPEIAEGLDAETAAQLIDDLEVTVELIDRVMLNARFSDAELWLGMLRLQRMIAKHRAKLESEHRIVSDKKTTAKVREIHVSIIGGIAAELLPILHMINARLAKIA